MDYNGLSEKESDYYQRLLIDALGQPNIYRILNNNIRAELAADIFKYE